MLAHSIRDTAGKIEANHFADSFSEARIVRGKADGVNGPVLFALNSDDLVIGATLSARKQYKLPLSGPLTPKPASDILGDILRNSTGLENAERRALRRAIARSNGNMSAAARGLGISRATLYRRATKLGLTGF